MGTSKHIFIVGPGRSGTSLLRTILNRHPDISVAPETHYLDIWRPRLFPDDRFDETRWAEYKASKHFTRLGLGSDSIQPPTEERAFFQELIAAHAAAQKGTPRIIGEKTPAHHHHIETLLRWFPSSLILFSSRDPRGVVASLKTLDESWAEKSIPAATRDWKQATSSYLQYEGHPQVRLVPFEGLVSDPERHVRPLLDVLGVGWRADMLTAKTDTKRHSNGSLIPASPIDDSRAKSWEGRLTRVEVATVEAMVIQEMQALGYAPESSATLRRLIRPIAAVRTGLVRVRNALFLLRDADLRARRANAVHRGVR